MGITRITSEEAAKITGETDRERLSRLTDEEIEERARSDPDNPPLTEEQLREFKPWRQFREERRKGR